MPCYTNTQLQQTQITRSTNHNSTLPGETPLRNAGKIRCRVARIVAKIRTDFYFSQRLQQQKSCETCSFQGMLHWAIFPPTCITTKLRDMLQKRLPGVTAPLALSTLHNFFVSNFRDQTIQRNPDY